MKHLLVGVMLMVGSVPVSGQEAPSVEPAVDEAMTLRPQVALAIAQAYGFDRWEQVDQIEFTFNAQSPQRDEPTTRQWTWRPKDRQVTLQRPGEDPIIYEQDQIGDGAPEEVVKADRQFVNDSYWFLFPFQIVWSDPTVTEHGPAPLPIGEGEATKVTVQYPDAGGYTPGDAYDLYLDDHHRIVQWAFRRGGGEKGSPVTWEEHVSLGPIIVSLEHRDANGHRRLWFSEVRVEVSDDQGEVAVHEPAPLDPSPR